MRENVYKEFKFYNWNITTDETARPTTIIQPNIPLKINIKNLNENYNRHKILNYYYEYQLQHPKIDFKNISKEGRHVVVNYYYEFLNQFNESTDTIIKSDSLFVTF